MNKLQEVVGHLDIRFGKSSTEKNASERGPVACSKRKTQYHRSLPETEPIYHALS
jgi:hypothetical protein